MAGEPNDEVTRRGAEEIVIFGFLMVKVEVEGVVEAVTLPNCVCDC